MSLRLIRRISSYLSKAATNSAMDGHPTENRELEFSGFGESKG